MRIERYILLLALLSFVLCPIKADTYWIQFTDKAGTIGTFENPTTLSERALNRRQAQGIAIDSLDLPVSAVYRDSVLTTGVAFVHQSRWHNGMTIETNDTATVAAIQQWTFVKRVERTQTNGLLPWPQIRKKRGETFDQEQTNTLFSDVFIQMLRLDSLHNRGFVGEGKQIAVVDDGFWKVDELEVFDSTSILGTCDFVQPGNSVYKQGDHGTMVLSTMAAQATNLYTGTAPQAGYYLLRSEDDDTESVREVDAQVAAFEWADSVGADIITSSLGYTDFDDRTMNYTYAMHDGKTLRNSIAATIAARKGMLVCISAGNEGAYAWHYMSSPADADSILCVGAVDADRNHAYFSSYGPSADGRVKPDVCAMGQNVSVVNLDNKMALLGLLFQSANGTSFSCPIMAGTAACLWSALPELTAMELRERILLFASQYDVPNDALGYGIPNVWYSYLNEDTALEEILIRPTDWTNAEVYDVQGRRVGNSVKGLQSGIYVQKKANAVRKIYVK